ncbi:DUF2255 family protein [Nonomuraea sp. NN258]|uniref:DUF2255 family protein n=1 Tax=Nonomuraea antri TaxID=2730852 RepID=UPI00156A3CCD|nr:DUF2255 family protein [Nonomuraea antri]NRQ32185.1 DUF2255 family protein [Nonomuraea antri]
MATWTSDELNRIEAADELRITPADGGAPGRPVTIWVVRRGDDLFVRSFKGRDGGWFRAAQASHEGHISAGGVDRDVTLAEERDPAVNEAIDDAYRTKYGRFSSDYVDPMVASGARETTLKLVPR